MKTEKVVKIVVSAILGIIIDQAFSITDIIREALEPFMVGPFLAPIKPLIILCFLLLEILGVYELLDKLKIFEKVFK
jgi:TRAP-type mannitol/chloroaromatic compound transport system permease small subunit